MGPVTSSSAVPSRPGFNYPSPLRYAQKAFKDKEPQDHSAGAAAATHPKAQARVLLCCSAHEEEKGLVQLPINHLPLCHAEAKPKHLLAMQRGKQTLRLRSG
jgi:hypothetical protein